MRYSPSFPVRIPCILSAALMLILHAGVAEESVRNTLNLCARVLIPSLFPYMVISAWIVRTGAAEFLGKPLAPIVRKLFKLPPCAGGALILGILCGFPLGAQAACDLYGRGSITQKEAERLIPLASCAGGAFTIEIIGTYLWKSRSFGIFLFIIQILSAWIIAAIPARLDSVPQKHTDTKTAPIHHSVSAGECLSDAIALSAVSMLKICGYVTFFSLLASVLQHFFISCRVPLLGNLTAAILELTTGCSTAAESGGVHGIFLTGLALGWSGLSVLFQCMTFTAPYGIRMQTAVISKGIQGILCGTAAVLWFLIRQGDLSVSCAASVYAIVPSYALYAEIALLILFCLFPLPRSLCACRTDRK